MQNQPVIKDSWIKEFDEMFVNTNLSGGYNNEWIKSFIRTHKEKWEESTAKAFGGCKNCFGKGYATVRYGLSGVEDIGGDYFEIAPKTNVHFCPCDRGKQLRGYFQAARKEGAKEERELITKILETKLKNDPNNPILKKGLEYAVMAIKNSAEKREPTSPEKDD